MRYTRKMCIRDSHLFKAFQIRFLNGDTADSLILTDQFFDALLSLSLIHI